MNADQRTLGAANGCLITLLLLAFPLVYGNWAAYKQWSNARLLETSGKVVQAEVLEVDTARGSRVGMNYGVTYRLPAYLNPSGKNYHATVNESVYQTASTDKTIAVKILADHPEIQKVVGGESPIYFIVLMALADVIFLFFLAIFIFGRNG